VPGFPLGLAAKVRPALLLTGEPAPDELDLVSVLLHTTSLRGNRWELNIPKPFLKPGAIAASIWFPMRCPFSRLWYDGLNAV